MFMWARIEAAIPIADILQPARQLGLCVDYRETFVNVNRIGTYF